MYRSTYYVLCLLLTAIVLCTTAESRAASLDEITHKLQTGQPLVFATFGDSITLPCYHTDYRQNYITFTVDALRQAYPKANITIVHAGNMGSTARGLAASRFGKHVLDHKPDVVFIMFGMNDCGGGERALDSFDANLTALTHKTQEAKALPIIATQNEIVYDSVDGRWRRTLPLYMARAVAVAKRENVPAVDCFRAWKPISQDHKKLIGRLNDWIHPNHAGHRLFAKTIVQTLWPKAAEFVSTEVDTPGNPKHPESVACLLPGPAGKQIVRIHDGTWFAISGRRRGGWLSDLVFSYCRKQQPQWSDFQHITLIGQKPQAVFDHQDRTLTAGMLLEQQGRLYVVFSWNVGVFMVSLDVTKPSWIRQSGDAAAWLEHTDQPFVRPTIVQNSTYREGGLLYDAVMQSHGWPAVFCSDRKKAPGSGWEIVAGTDGISLVTRPPGARDPKRDFLFPRHHMLRCTQTADRRIHYIAQQLPNGPLRTGTIGFPPDKDYATKWRGHEFVLPSLGAQATAVIQAHRLAPDNAAQWLLLRWQPGHQPDIRNLQPPPNHPRARPLPWSDRAHDGICWHEIPPSKTGQASFAYQSSVKAGAKWLGLLVNDQGQLRFMRCSLSP